MTEHSLDPGSPRYSTRLVIGLVLVVVVSGAVVFDGLGDSSFFGDEAIYAVVSQETVKTGVWFPLHFGGKPYLHKPPLKITLVSVLFKFFGESEFIARMPDAVFGVTTIALVYLFGVRFFGFLTGLLASAVLLGAESYVLVHGVRDSTQDSLITLLAFVGIWAWIVLRSDPTRRRGMWWIAMAAFVAVGFCKNPLGVFFSLLFVVIELATSIRERRASMGLKPAVLLLGTAVVASAIYGVAIGAVTGDSYVEQLIDDVVVRASSGLDKGHIEGPFFYASRLVLDFDWWLLLLVPAGWAVTRSGAASGRRTTVFLFSWAALLVFGLSFSVSKLPWYIYPSYPAISVLVAVGAGALVRKVRLRPFQGAVLLGLLVMAAIRVDEVRGEIRADNLVLDAHVFADRLSEVENARLVVDEWPIHLGGGLRTCDRYYLGAAGRVEWLGVKDRSFSFDPGDRLFLACADPRSHPPTRAMPWRPVAVLGPVDPQAPGIWILSTNEFEIPGLESGDPAIFGDLIVAEDFEGADSGALIAAPPRPEKL